MTSSPWYFKRIALFGQLNAEKLRQLESRSLYCEFLKDRIVYLPHGHEDDVLVVTKGKAELQVRDSAANDRIIVAKGDMLGGIPCETVTDRQSPLTTLTRSIFVLIPKSEMLKLIETETDSGLLHVSVAGWRHQLSVPWNRVLFRSPQERLQAVLTEAFCNRKYSKSHAFSIAVRDVTFLTGLSLHSIRTAVEQIGISALVEIGSRNLRCKNPVSLTKILCY